MFPYGPCDDGSGSGSGEDELPVPAEEASFTTEEPAMMPSDTFFARPPGKEQKPSIPFV